MNYKSNFRIQLKEYYKQQLFKALLNEDDALPPTQWGGEENPDWGVSPEDLQRQREDMERERNRERLRDYQRERWQDEFFENIPGDNRPLPEGVTPPDWHRFPKGIQNPVPDMNPNDVRYEDLGNGYGQIYVWNGERWVPYGGPQLLPNDRYPGFLPPDQRPVVLPPAPGWQYYPDKNGNPGYFLSPDGGIYRWTPNGFQLVQPPPNIPSHVQPRPFPPQGFPNPQYTPPITPGSLPVTPPGGNPGPNPGGNPGSDPPGQTPIYNPADFDKPKPKPTRWWTSPFRPFR